MRARLRFHNDREFLPAALEVLETPASPLRRVLMLTVCSFVALAAAWSCFGRVDIEAVAKGKIEPKGRNKVIEPLEPGRTARVFVEDGAIVHRGDALVAFDRTEAEADATQARQSLSVALADAARYGAALRAAAGETPGVGVPAIAWDPRVPAELQQRETETLGADIIRFHETLRSFDEQAAEKRATLKRLDDQITSDTALIATAQERVTMRQTLVAHDAGTRSSLIDAVQDHQKAEASLVADKGARGEAEAALTTLEGGRDKAVAETRADNAAKRDQAVDKADAYREILAKAEARLDRTTLLAPIDGIVQKLAVTTVGQVVTTGQDLMIIVPSEGGLEVQAFVDNADVGFIKPGQEVVVKLDAFPFTRYGTLTGTVRSIANNAIDQGEARRMQANETSLASSAASVGTNDPEGQRFVFPITIALPDRVFQAGALAVPLTPGMSVTAEIKTDRQRLIDYVLSPLTQVGSEALHER
ncbi:HlyD family type I secretion periplasmic adaptor subunit [Lichenihabitans sp. Uapishka_5]|uniref:HlyD family type I secretion periplasmic adaptor subunit n=1 Tax=Lichenihabitans sp. Uapishka_5 TaxID=3037302 RepID=UPI0029E823EE|nr:HlyD family type I secretion periplasmic adaptor subunit [Lichenihabitans sp. Uapishka_5]MDX7952820.1 HlyD family type I secretion periplasmic adaptor subunit [Lichenihabitans sp. Uapishka_5]